MRRHTFLKLLSTTALAGYLPGPARAAAPALRLFIPANAGGGWDTTGRELGSAMVRAGLVASVSFENRGGAAGTIGLAQFATNYKGRADALMVMGSVMLGGIIMGRPPVGLERVQPLAKLTNEYNVFVLPPGSPFGSMKEVLQQFQANPSSIKWGGGSRGSTEHIAIHMVARELGVAARHINYVPFRGGGEAAAAIMGGHVSVGGSGYSEFMPHIRSGRMKAVAVTSPHRQTGMDTPTLKELGLDIEIGNWRGLCAAGGLLPAQLEHLQRLVEQTLAMPAWQEAVRRHGWLPEPLIGAPFEAFVAREFDAMRQVLQRAGLA